MTKQLLLGHVFFRSKYWRGCQRYREGRAESRVKKRSVRPCPTFSTIERDKKRSDKSCLEPSYPRGDEQQE
ncbi:hypothetical protein ACFP56_13190 [Paenibacillus septentrionalis]|uniref:Uncharacterized protein n=1 Tax=Paenibacillus septentrionalis TaxID=429342 RepID=A0ABW1V474_9BACL